MILLLIVLISRSTLATTTEYRSGRASHLTKHFNNMLKCFVKWLARQL